MDVRSPAVAGQFYPGEKGELTEEIESQLDSQRGRIDLSLADRKLIGGVTPHAGYVFSLPQAVHLFEILRSSGKDWDRVVLLNPNHTGRGAPLSIDSHGKWSTPLGQVDLDEEGIIKLIEGREDYPIIREPLAHKREHAGEVILPLLQYFLSSFKLIPLCMGDGSFDAARSVADRLSRISAELSGETLIIASSDFTHYRSPKEGRELDDYALEALTALDTAEFYRRVQERRLSICGYGPIMVLMEYAKKTAENPKTAILSRGHSGESPYFRGVEQKEVVDYVSLLVYEE